MNDLDKIIADSGMENLIMQLEEFVKVKPNSETFRNMLTWAKTYQKFHEDLRNGYKTLSKMIDALHNEYETMQKKLPDEQVKSVEQILTNSKLRIHENSGR